MESSERKQEILETFELDSVLRVDSERLRTIVLLKKKTVEGGEKAESQSQLSNSDSISVE